MRKKYTGLLPLDGTLLGKWKKEELLGFGEGASLCEHVYVYNNLEVGKKARIRSIDMLDSTGWSEMNGARSINDGVMFVSYFTIRCVSNDKMQLIKKPVRIEDYMGL